MERKIENSVEYGIVLGKLTGEIQICTLASMKQNRISRHLHIIDGEKENRAYRQITSHRKIIGRFIIFIKRIIRRCMKFYIEPVCDQQTDFNCSTYIVLNEMYEHIMRQNERIVELENEVQKLKNNFCGEKNTENGSEGLV